jgi:hypothetical protein
MGFSSIDRHPNLLVLGKEEKVPKDSKGRLKRDGLTRPKDDFNIKQRAHREDWDSF